MAKNKIDISYITGKAEFYDLGPCTIYFFYPDGMWDEDKLIYEEALLKYPADIYNWVLIDDEDENA